jgi:uncharacterized membrane protein
MGAGVMGPLPANQATLAVFSLLMIGPILMAVLNLALSARAGRRANLAAGVVYGLVNIMNLVGESYAYYLLFGAAELALVAAILATAVRRPAVSG